MKKVLHALFTTRPLSSDVGLLVLRLGVAGSMFLFHGWGKITGGPERWERLGGAMANLGITFAPTFWGFMASVSESVFALLLVLGVATRPAAFLLGLTMLVASIRHLSLPEGSPGAGWSGASHALEILAVCACLLLAGPGRFAVRLPSKSGEPGRDA